LLKEVYHSTKVINNIETFENRSISFKFKEGENFNHRNTLSILRINPPKIGGGLKFEPDAEIGRKGALCKGLTFRSKNLIHEPIILTKYY
jgi:hypothetical protein